jgi:hypothetical protein
LRDLKAKAEKMDDKNIPDEKIPDKETLKVSPQPKKTYQTPTLKFERVFEVSALACGKVFSTEGGCRISRKAS